MGIDIDTEEVVGLVKAHCFYPTGRGGNPVAASTPWRHALKGVKVGHGRVIRLEAVRCGKHWMTSREAVRRFFDALTAAFLERHQSADELAARPQDSGEESRQDAIARQVEAAALG